MNEPLHASVPLVGAPVWALQQRRLFAVIEEAWRLFDEFYTLPDGRLDYAGRMFDRDGVDDFYEPFFSWPTFHRLGGSAEILASAKRHWEGVTRQLTEIGFVHDEFELGYDWFHQGESLEFFYALCAADPADERLRALAERFAGFYLGDSPLGNYDAEKRIIVAPHTGSGGPRFGVGDIWSEYRADQPGMQLYGLPLQDVAGIRSWDDLADPANARRMGDAMQERLGRGDVAIDLAATSLMVNAWLYPEHPDAGPSARAARSRYADWVLEYVGAWRERAAANTAPDALGVVPDNVGPSGEVGELHGGAWYGGHYGWTWPHGLHSVEPAVLTACLAESIVTGRTDGFDLARRPLEAVLRHAVVTDRVAERGSLGPGWAQKLAAADDDELLLVPYRYGPEGWFDLHPLPVAFPMWLWWLTGSAEDAAVLADLRERSGYDWNVVRRSHDKEEQGHEPPWLEYLAGRKPSYPEEALALALAQVDRKLDLMRASPSGPAGDDIDDIHWWQRLNPVAVEVLLQLTTGSPPALYNGGLQPARVLYGDADLGRPGLPTDVAALVDRVDDSGVSLTLVNLGATVSRTVTVQAGAFGEDRIDAVRHDRLGAGSESGPGSGYPGSSRDYDIPEPVVETVEAPTAVPPTGSSRITVVLPPSRRIRLELDITRRAFPPAHRTFGPVPSPASSRPGDDGRDVKGTA